MNDIIPAVLPHSFEDVVQSLARLRGCTALVQLDICDGMFVTSRTWPLNPTDRAGFADIVRGEIGLPYWEDFSYEVDLMVHSPEKYLSTWIAVGATRAVVHLESRHNWADIKEAAGETVELGLAIDLDPPYEKLETYVPRVEYLQIMGIPRLGKQGTELDERVYPLLSRVRSDFPDVTIQIDGGVSLDNARALLDAGADRLVVGSKIVNAPSPQDALKDFQNV